MSRRFCFRTAFSSQHINESQTMLKSARRQFYPIISLFRDKLSWKTSLNVRSDILGLFVNTLTSNDKNSCHNRENFPQPIQITRFSKRPKTSCEIFIASLKYI